MNAKSDARVTLRRLALRLAPLACAVALAASPPARAHAIHTSYAEADYRRDSGKLEIALRLFTDDTEAALTRRARKKISLANTPAAELDALLAAYVRATFVVKSADGATRPLAWIGRELKDGEQHLWLYFECALPNGLTGVRLADRVLRESFRDQLNSVRVRDPGPPARQVTLLFADDAEQPVAWR